MANYPVFSRRLAVAFLAGPWTHQGLTERAKVALGSRGKWRWVEPLAHRVLDAFAGRVTAPSLRQLTAFIDEDRGLQKALRRYASVPHMDLLALPSPPMLPVAGEPGSWRVPRLTTTGNVADWLELGTTAIDWLADCNGFERRRTELRLQNYRYQWRTKSRGCPRLIECPKYRLKSIQRRILKGILERIPPHDAAHAFRRKRSSLTFAQPHVGQAVILRIDLREFFPSIAAVRIFGLFRTVGYPEAVARILTGFCTNSVPTSVLQRVTETASLPQHERLSRIYSSPHLPQGAPTSPALANLVAYRLDCRLAGLARKSGVIYSRYADDLVFSGDQGFRRSISRFRVFACAIALDEGFAIQRRKTRVMSHGGRQHIAGLVVNARLNVARKEYDALKATLYNCACHGPGTQNRGQHASFREHLLGRIGYIAMTNPKRGRRLRELFKQIVWAE